MIKKETWIQELQEELERILEDIGETDRNFIQIQIHNEPKRYCDTINETH